MLIEPKSLVCTDAMLNPFPVLVVSANQADHDLFHGFLSRIGYALIHAFSVAEAVSLLDGETPPVVITEPTLPDGSWVGIQADEGHPFPPPLVIVYSDPADATFWAQAYNLGAFDVLYRPLAERVVDRAVNLANLRWCRSADQVKARAAALLMMADKKLGTRDRRQPAMAIRLAAARAQARTAAHG